MIIYEYWSFRPIDRWFSVLYNTYTLWSFAQKRVWIVSRWIYLNRFQTHNNKNNTQYRYMYTYMIRSSNPSPCGITLGHFIAAAYFLPNISTAIRECHLSCKEKFISTIIPSLVFDWKKKTNIKYILLKNVWERVHKAFKRVRTLFEFRIRYDYSLQLITGDMSSKKYRY